MRYFNKLSIVFLIIGQFLISGCAQKKKMELENLSWTGQMGQFAQVITDFYPLVASKKQFNDPKNFKKIDEGVDKLSLVVHEVSKMSPPRKRDLESGDPSLPYIAAGFSGEVMRAQLALKDGKREYARSVLRSVTQFCIQCHTRSQQGTQITAEVKDDNGLPANPLEKAELLMAVRKYDQSLEIYELILKNKKLAKSNSFLWEKAARNSLNLAVRVKQDPNLALKLVRMINETPEAPKFLREDSAKWKKSLLGWKKEKRSPSMGIGKAKRLIKKAELVKAFAEDQGGYIYYLRASSLLHEHLRLETKQEKVGQVLYLLGQCYDSIDRRGDWRLSDLFYEACVHQSPYTDLARKCYGRYEANKHFGFGGSAGLSVPGSIMDHLDELRDKIGPKRKRR